MSRYATREGPPGHAEQLTPTRAVETVGSPQEVSMTTVQDKFIARPEKLASFCAKALEAVGVPAEDAEVTAHILVEANLRGVDTHGVVHLSREYVGFIKTGRVNPRPRITLNHGSATTAVMEADKGLGHVVGHRAMTEAIAMAREHGSGWVSVRNSTHFGPAAYYAMMALEHEMIGFSFTTGGRLVAAPGAAERFAGANVICVAAPGKNHGPFVLDMCTSVVAGGKMELALRGGDQIPEGWTVDKQGLPITDPEVYFSELGALLPLGGTVAGGAYKGFGLALVVDILVGLLSGSGGSILQTVPTQSHAFGALSIDAFPSGQDFRGLMDRMLEEVMATPALEGQGNVRYPGERAKRTHAERSRNGIPLHAKVVAALEETGEELGIAFDIF